MPWASPRVSASMIRAATLRAESGGVDFEISGKYPVTTTIAFGKVSVVFFSSTFISSRQNSLHLSLIAWKLKSNGFGISIVGTPMSLIPPVMSTRPTSSGLTFAAAMPTCVSMEG